MILMNLSLKSLSKFKYCEKSIQFESILNSFWISFNQLCKNKVKDKFRYLWPSQNMRTLINLDQTHLKVATEVLE